MSPTGPLSGMGGVYFCLVRPRFRTRLPGGRSVRRMVKNKSLQPVKVGGIFSFVGCITTVDFTCIHSWKLVSLLIAIRACVGFAKCLFIDIDGFILGWQPQRVRKPVHKREATNLVKDIVGESAREVGGQCNTV